MLKLRIFLTLASLSLVSLIGACSVTADGPGIVGDGDAGIPGSGDHDDGGAGTTDAGRDARADGGASSDSGPTGTCSPAPSPGCDPPVELNPDDHDFYVMSALVDHSGRALAVGWSNPNGSATPSLFVARFAANGSADTAFGSGGVAEIDLEDDTNDIPAVVRADIDSTGRVVVLFSHNKVVSANVNPELVVVRLDDTGHLDASFGSGGRTVGIADPSQTAQHGAALAVVGDKALVFASIERSVDILSPPETVLRGVRVNANGTLDGTYGFAGNAGSSQQAFAVSFSGGAYLSSGERLWKLTTSGNIDPTFGTAGYVDGGFGTFTVLADGSVLSSSGGELQTLAPSGIGGMHVFADHGAGTAAGERCDGQIATASASGSSKTITGSLFRTDGTLDPSRGTAGIVTCPMPSTVITSTWVTAIDRRTGTITIFMVKNASAESLVAIRLHP